MEFALLIWLLCGIAAAVVGSGRGANGCLWFAVGVALGPIGFALAFTAGTKCPRCASTISETAIVCPKCQVNLKEAKWGDAEASTKICQFCAEKVLRAAKKCRYCGEFFPEAPPPLPSPRPTPMPSSTAATVQLKGAKANSIRIGIAILAIVFGATLLVLKLSGYFEGSGPTVLTPEQQEHVRSIKEMLDRQK